MRAGELSGRLTDAEGRIDPKMVENWFDLAAKLEAATHGQVNAQTLLGLAQQGGGVALRGLSQEGYEHMAIVAQMMGGQRAGTSLLSLRSQMTGAMLKRSAEAMQDYGILGSDEWGSEGGHVTLSDAATHRMLNTVNKDPMDFVNMLVDRLEAKGITNKDDQMVALQRILGRQTTQRMVADMLLARQQIASGNRPVLSRARPFVRVLPATAPMYTLASRTLQSSVAQSQSLQSEALRAKTLRRC